ncbi:MAG: putative DNA binding domain-containing protein [Bacteroidales bacterium]|nr:putative DNA binding domain-containing protein [Bacteroidales bacterium]
MIKKENQTIEFKQNWRDEYLQYVSGFANAQGGTLFIGVDDNGNVIENVLENSVETSASLAKHFGVNERTIRRDLQFLQAKGIIRRVGPDKGGHWEIVGQ